MSSALNFGDQLVDGNTRFKRLYSLKLSSHSPGPINAIAISPDGTLLASADDGGGLEVRMYDQKLHHWVLVRKYARGGQIRALQWWRLSSSTSWSLFLGSNFGLIWKITLNFDERNPFSTRLDIIGHAKADGYVHCLAVDAEGRLIIASGDTVKLYDKPFHTKNELGPALLFRDAVPTTTTDERAAFEAQYDIRWVPRVRKFHFLRGNSMVLLSFFGYVGIHIYSMTNGMQQFSIPLRPGHIVGSSALAPGGDILAVTNLHDGVDWYSISLMKYLTTTTFDVAPAPARNIIVDLVFVDQTSVAVGHSRGDFIVATFGFPKPIRHDVRQDEHHANDLSSAVSNVIFGISDSMHLILRPETSGSGKSGRRFVLQVRQILASKDRMRQLSILADTRSRGYSEGYNHKEQQTSWDAIKNYPLSLALVSIWGAISIFIYPGNLSQIFVPSFLAAPAPIATTPTETEFSTTTVTMISMAQATHTTTSVSTITNWQTVTMTPPPTSSACFCTVMLSGILQQAHPTIETGLTAGDRPAPSFIDQSHTSIN